MTHPTKNPAASNEITCLKMSGETPMPGTIITVSGMSEEHDGEWMFVGEHLGKWTLRRKNPSAVALGSLGGRVRSKAKTRAAKRNGRKGGLTSEQALAMWRKRKAATP